MLQWAIAALIEMLGSRKTQCSQPLPPPQQPFTEVAHGISQRGCIALTNAHAHTCRRTLAAMPACVWMARCFKAASSPSSLRKASCSKSHQIHADHHHHHHHQQQQHNYYQHHHQASAAGTIAQWRLERSSAGTQQFAAAPDAAQHKGRLRTAAPLCSSPSQVHGSNQGTN